MDVNWGDVFAKHPSLQTERCNLRPVRMDDVPAIYELMGNPEVTKYLGRHPLKAMEDAEKTVQRYMKQFENQLGMVWVICNRDDNQVIGNCLVFNLVKPHFRGEIGYALIPEWWGKGIMSEVLPLTINFAFESMKLHSLFAQIDPANVGSRRLLEKFDFVQEAYFHEDFFHPVEQKFTDTVILSLLKSTRKERT